MREALIGPLRNVHGISDKVIAMALSSILLAAPKNRPHWHEAGASLIAVDTLVHNFLHRTGILRRFAAEHAYGLACYRPGGCAEIIQAVADRIDAREFGRALSPLLSPVRSARHLAILRAARPRHLQRQPDRR